MLHPEGRSYRHLEYVWGTAVTIDIREIEDELPAASAIDDAIAEAVADMKRTDRIFSTYRPDSLVTALRIGTAREDSLSDYGEDGQALRDVLSMCRAARRFTDACFDPWAVPGGFDPSGIVKGLAAERIARNLVAAGMNNVCVNAGGDVVVRGLAAPGQPWSVGVRHPDDSASVVRTFVSEHAAIATSGNYERGEHIVNPRTGAPASGARSATVVGPDAGLAEALSTALVVAGRDGMSWFAELPGWQAFVVDPLPAATAWSIEGPASQHSLG